MKLSEYAKTPVRAVDLWAAGALILVVVGAAYLLARHLPGISRWLWGGALFAVWVVSLYHLVRYDRRAFPWQRVTALAGYTLFAGGHLWPHPPPVVSWWSGAGEVLLFASVLAQFFVFDRRREGIPGDTGHTPAV